MDQTEIPLVINKIDCRNNRFPFHLKERDIRFSACKVKGPNWHHVYICIYIVYVYIHIYIAYIRLKGLIDITCARIRVICLAIGEVNDAIIRQLHVYVCYTCTKCIIDVYMYAYLDIYITSIAHQIKNPLRRTSEHITLHDLKH